MGAHYPGGRVADHCTSSTCKFKHCGRYKESESGCKVTESGVTVRVAGGDDWLRINLHEDNTTCIQSARTGKNQTMKTLERGFGVSIGWINEKINSGMYNLIHTRTDDMSADIYTKCIQDHNTWRHLKRIINVYSPQEVDEGSFDPDIAGGDTAASSDLNPHYWRIMSGSSNDTDQRKAVKTKPSKFKPKPAPVRVSDPSGRGPHTGCSRTTQYFDMTADDFITMIWAGEEDLICEPVSK